MAYAKKLDIKCQGACGRNATDEVFDRYNESHGKYCPKCAFKAVGALKKTEK